MSYEDFIWKALEGGLGRRKTAYLKNSPVHEIVRNKVASEQGVNLDGEMSLGDAIASTAISWRKKKAEHRITMEGLESLKKILRAQRNKTASADESLFYPPGTSTLKKIATATKLRILEKNSDPILRNKIASALEHVDADIISSLKKEAFVRGLVSNPAVRNVGKGLAWGTGFAVPTAIGANVVGNRLSEKATQDARDKAMDVARGVSALTVGTYGLGKTINHAFEQRKAQNLLKMQEDHLQKMHDKGLVRGYFPGAPGSAGSVEKSASHPEEDLQLFKTAMYVDSLLDAVPQTEKVSRLRAKNSRRAVDILSTGLQKTAEHLVYFHHTPSTAAETALSRLANVLGGAMTGASLGGAGAAAVDSDFLRGALFGAAVGGVGGMVMPTPKERLRARNIPLDESTRRMLEAELQGHNRADQRQLEGQLLQELLGLQQLSAAGDKDAQQLLSVWGM